MKKSIALSVFGPASTRASESVGVQSKSTAVQFLASGIVIGVQPSRPTFRDDLGDVHFDEVDLRYLLMSESPTKMGPIRLQGPQHVAVKSTIDILVA